MPAGHVLFNGSGYRRPRRDIRTEEEKRPVKTEVREDVMMIGRVTIYPASRTVKVEGREVYLKPREFALLVFLASNLGRTFTREELLTKVWNYDYVATTRTVDVHVRQLRKKIEPNPKEPTYVQTIWGVGYRLNPDVK